MNFLAREEAGLLENAPVYAHRDGKSQMNRICPTGTPHVLYFQPGLCALEGALSPKCPMAP